MTWKSQPNGGTTSRTVIEQAKTLVSGKEPPSLKTRVRVVKAEFFKGPGNYKYQAELCRRLVQKCREERRDDLADDLSDFIARKGY